MELTRNDKNLIKYIDCCVGNLLKNVPSYEILNILVNYINDVKDVMNSACEKQLGLYCEEYKNFRRFIELIMNKLYKI